MGKVVPIISKSSTRFVSTSKGLVDLAPTLERITKGIKYPHKNDGSIFKNAQKLLPSKPAGYYTEYVVPTPGVSHAGLQRIIKGSGGEMYFSPDHYSTFIPIIP